MPLTNLNSLLDSNSHNYQLESVENICLLSSLYNSKNEVEQLNFSKHYLIKRKEFGKAFISKRVSLIPLSRRNIKCTISGKPITNNIEVFYLFFNNSDNEEDNENINKYFHYDTQSIFLQCEELGLDYTIKYMNCCSNNGIFSIGINNTINASKKKEGEELYKVIAITCKSIANNPDNIEKIWSSYGSYVNAIKNNDKIDSAHISTCPRIFSSEKIFIGNDCISKTIKFHTGENKNYSVEIKYRVINTTNCVLIAKYIDNKINNIITQIIDAGLVYNYATNVEANINIYTLRIE